MPTADQLLQEARARFAAAGNATPALDARLLLQHAAGVSHERLVATPEMPVSAEDAASFAAMMVRRLAGEPVSRILGSREFFGRAFDVTPAVLDPRPDTESLIELCLSEFPEGAGRVLDLGTGSGIIVITLLSEWLSASGLGVDISRDALAVATANAMRLGVGSRLQFALSTWFSGVEGRFDLIVSNPPYIEHAAIAGLDVEVRGFDPVAALDGGPSGLDAYAAIAAGAAAHLNAAGRIAVEIGAGQEAGVSNLFVANGFRLLRTNKDLGGHVRALLFAATTAD